MPQDIIQIGPLAIPKILIDILFPLIGTIIGGFISYFSIRAVENLKWAQQKSDKYQEECKEAIAATFEWLDPFRDAITKAQSLVGDFIMGRVNEEEYALTWPQLIGNPKIKDPPKRMRILLPKEIYPRFMSIIMDLEKIRTLPLLALKGTPEFGENYRQAQESLSNLEKMIDSLESDLVNEYKKSFAPAIK